MDIPTYDKIGRSLDKKVTKRYVQIFTVFVNNWMVRIWKVQKNEYNMTIHFYFLWPFTFDLTSNFENFKCKKDFPAVTICNQNQMKRSSVFGTRFEPLLRIDDQIQADQAQFQAINVRKRRQISG